MLQLWMALPISATKLTKIKIPQLSKSCMQLAFFFFFQATSNISRYNYCDTDWLDSPTALKVTVGGEGGVSAALHEWGWANQSWAWKGEVAGGHGVYLARSWALWTSWRRARQAPTSPAGSQPSHGPRTPCPSPGRWALRTRCCAGCGSPASSRCHASVGGG